MASSGLQSRTRSGSLQVGHGKVLERRSVLGTSPAQTGHFISRIVLSPGQRRRQATVSTFTAHWDGRPTTQPPMPFARPRHRGTRLCPAPTGPPAGWRRAKTLRFGASDAHQAIPRQSPSCAPRQPAHYRPHTRIRKCHSRQRSIPEEEPQRNAKYAYRCATRLFHQRGEGHLHVGRIIPRLDSHGWMNRIRASDSAWRSTPVRVRCETLDL